VNEIEELLDRQVKLNAARAAQRSCLLEAVRRLPILKARRDALPWWAWLRRRRVDRNITWLRGYMAAPWGSVGPENPLEDR
jgi:hypothetical protein